MVTQTDLSEKLPAIVKKRDFSRMRWDCMIWVTVMRKLFNCFRNFCPKFSPTLINRSQTETVSKLKVMKKIYPNIN